MRALITGVTGQDGSYLAEQLTGVGHIVYGLVRGQPTAKWAQVQGLAPGLRLLQGDLLDQPSLQAALHVAQPDVVFNLGALTSIGMSWGQPIVMSEVTGMGCLRLLEAVRAAAPAARVVQASSADMFGLVTSCPQDESTPLKPRTPYGVAKAFAHETVASYREAYGMHASTAILFNHVSPRSAEELIVRKVTAAAARIAAGRQDKLTLGRVDARRDWGWAPDFTRALPLIAEHDTPGDYVLATGESHSVMELVEAAFAAAGITTGPHLESDPALLRPGDTDERRGDYSKASALLGWEPSVLFGEIVTRLVASDMAMAAA
jgi:GDPmannose 4,6-dehydratase